MYRSYFNVLQRFFDLFIGVGMNRAIWNDNYVHMGHSSFAKVIEDLHSFRTGSPSR